MAAFRTALLFWLLSCISALAQLYPLPPYQPTTPVTGPSTTVLNDLMAWGNTAGTSAIDTGIPMGTVVTGPGSTTINHVALWGNTLGTKLIDGGANLAGSGPAVGSCAPHNYVTGYPTTGSLLTCIRPVTGDLSDINTFSLSTSGSVAAGNITGLALAATGVFGSTTLLSLANARATVFSVSALGIPTLASVPTGTYPTQLIWNGPPGSHQTPQEWFEMTGPSGVVRYVPGF